MDHLKLEPMSLWGVGITGGGFTHDAMVHESGTIRFMFWKTCTGFWLETRLEKEGRGTKLLYQCLPWSSFQVLDRGHYCVTFLSEDIRTGY